MIERIICEHSVCASLGWTFELTVVQTFNQQRAVTIPKTDEVHNLSLWRDILISIHRHEIILGGYLLAESAANGLVVREAKKLFQLIIA